MSQHYFQGPGRLVPNVFFWLATTWGVAGGLAAEPELIGHWPLRGDAKDASPQGRHGTVHGATLSAQGATFDGLDDWIEIPGFGRGELGTGDLTIAAWVQSPVGTGEVPVFAILAPELLEGIGSPLRELLGSVCAAA